MQPISAAPDTSVRYGLCLVGWTFLDRPREPGTELFPRRGELLPIATRLSLALAHGSGPILHRVRGVHLRDAVPLETACKKQKVLWSLDAGPLLAKTATWAVLQVLALLDPPLQAAVTQASLTGRPLRPGTCPARNGAPPSAPLDKARWAAGRAAAALERALAAPNPAATLAVVQAAYDAAQAVCNGLARHRPWTELLESLVAERARTLGFSLSSVP
jgi:hypothetical protein